MIRKLDFKGDATIIKPKISDVFNILKDRRFDVVYFDPMFRSAISDSAGIKPLRGFANLGHLEIRAIVEIFSNIKSLINIARAVDMDYTLSGVARMVIVF